MATAYTGAATGTNAAATADNTQFPDLDPSLQTVQMPHAKPLAQSQATDATSILGQLAKHLGIKQKVGQDLTTLVIEKLQQLPAAPNNNNLQASAPTPSATSGGRKAGATEVPRPTPRSADVHLPSKLPKARTKYTDMRGVRSQKLPPVTPEEKPKSDKQRYPAGGKGPDNTTSASDVPNRYPAGGKGPVDSPDAIAAIAAKLGANGSDLAAIAAKIGATTTGTGSLNLGTQQGDNGATIYSAFAKRVSSDSAYKTGWTAALAKAGLLDASQNNGSPDNATIGRAFQQLMQKSVAAGTSVDETVVSPDLTVQRGPDGKPIQSTTSELEAFVQGMGEKFGIHLTPTDINTIANKYKADTPSNGISGIADEVKNDVVQYFNPNDPLNPPGAANEMYIKIQSAGQKFGIPMNQQDIMGWVKNGIRNSAGDGYSIAQAAANITAAAEQHFQQLAQGLYPALAGQIGTGMDVASLIAPYNNITAQYTGKDPAALANAGVDPTSPNYKFLQGAQDPKTGAPTMMTMDAWKKTLMSDPQYGFQNTTGAHDMASQFTSALLNAFGKVKTEGTPGSFSGYSGNPGSANT